MTKKILFVVTEDWYFLSHRLNLALHAINNGFEVFLITNCPKLKDKIEKRGIKVIDWKLKRKSFNPLKEILSIIRLYKTINTIKPDLVHSVAMKPIVYSCLIKFFYNNYVSIYSFTGLGYIFTSNTISARFLKNFLILFFKFFFKKKKTFISLQNKDDLELFKIKKMISENKISLIEGSGVDEQFFKISSNKNFSKKTILLASRMLWTKGIREFVECAELIKLDKPEFRFLLVGDPDDENPNSISLNYLNDLNKGDIVEWLGFKKDMLSIYKDTLIVVFPSYREGLPMTLLEAASCELPIVSFDVTGCKSIVKDNVNGYLVPFRETKIMASKILELIENKELRLEFGINGRKIVKNSFTTKIINSKFLKLWNKSLNNE